MKPSFLSSTLSIAFILCVISVIAMTFLQIDPNEKLLAIQMGIITGYLTARSSKSNNSDNNDQK